MKDIVPQFHRVKGTSIVTLRGVRVIMDIHLAALYGVAPKRLREQVRRNPHRFPPDFAFQLTQEEREEVAAFCGDLRSLKYAPTAPWAFSEQGVLMAAGVLTSRTAIEMSIFLVRTFVDLRREVLSYRSLTSRLDAFEKRYDRQFRAVFEAIRELIRSNTPVRTPMGFQPPQA